MVEIRKIDDRFSVTGQIEVSDIPAIADAGFKVIVCNRPDNEAAGQPKHEVFREAAATSGISFVYIPVAVGAVLDKELALLAKALADNDGPALGFCRSGLRAENLYQMASAA